MARAIRLPAGVPCRLVRKPNGIQVPARQYSYPFSICNAGCFWCAPRLVLSAAERMPYATPHRLMAEEALIGQNSLWRSSCFSDYFALFKILQGETCQIFCGCAPTNTNRQFRPLIQKRHKIVGVTILNGPKLGRAARIWNRFKTNSGANRRR